MADGDALIEAPGERELLASIDAAVVAADADGRVTLWNRAAERIFGRPAGEMLGTQVGELGDGLLTAFEVAAAGSGYAGELQVLRSDGTERTLASTVSPVRGPDGRVGGAIAVLNDVSELRRGEDAIRRRHELYRLVLENVDDLIVLATPDGRLLYASPSHLRRLGWSSEELVGVNALSRIHPDDVARLERRLGEALDSGTAVVEPVRVQRRDGGWVPLEARLVALKDEQAEETLVLSVARDVSETREAEASARESRELLEAVLGAVPDAIVVLSRSGEFFYVNRPALDLLGYEDAATMLRAGSAEVLARFELLDEDGAPLPVERLPTRRVFGGAGEAEELVRYRVRASGEERYSVVRALPVRVEGAEPDLAVTIFHDVTDERRGSRRLQFLAETSAALGGSLDAESALRGLERLIVPEFAAGYAAELADGGAVEAGTRSGKATALPLVSRGRRLGTLTLFDTRDAELAEELASRIATTVDNARLHRETGRAAALLDTLFATAPVGLAFLDRECRFVRVNGALAEINGLSEQEHVGRRLRELIPTVDPEIEERFRRVLETGEPLLDQEETGATPAHPGEERHFRVSYYPIR
ncbi:MAG TPA: PAS domain S-box protein, partial [Gaiellaceae bacterium]